MTHYQISNRSKRNNGGQNNMRIKLQPQELPDMTLPYPYFVEEDGSVGRQDFWKGNPKKLLGFSAEPVAGQINKTLAELFDDPWMCQGFYPVFENADGEWVTQTNPIETAKFVEERK